VGEKKSTKKTKIEAGVEDELECEYFAGTSKIVGGGEGKGGGWD
jgi:hypothetical protein